MKVRNSQKIFRLCAAGLGIAAVLLNLTNLWFWWSGGDSIHTGDGQIRLHDLQFILMAAAKPGQLDYWQSVHFVYPPLVAALTAPLAAMPYQYVWKGWMAFSLLCYLASILLILKIFPALSRLYAVLLALALWPFFWSLMAGQNSCLSLLLVMGVICLLKEKKVFAAALLLSLIFYKPQLLGCILVVFLLARQWQAAVAAGLAGLLGLLVGIVVCGWKEYLWWFGVLSGGAGNGFLSPINCTLIGTLKSAQAFLPIPTLVVQLFWVLAMAGMGYFWFRRFGEKALRLASRPERFLVALASILAVSPYFVGYDLTIFAPCFVLAIHWALRENSWSMLISTAMLVLATICSFLSWEWGINFAFLPWIFWLILLIRKTERAGTI